MLSLVRSHGVDVRSRRNPGVVEHRIPGVGGGDDDIGIAYRLLGCVHRYGVALAGQGKPPLGGSAPDFHMADGTHDAHSRDLRAGLETAADHSHCGGVGTG